MIQELFRWGRRKVRRRSRRTSSVTKHYLENKELARALVADRLEHFNQHYNVSWNRVAIRNQRRCWGSCSSKKNLNFNYKLLLLPPHLRDYIIVHELCHLVHLNHGKEFWHLVAEQVPQYRACVAELRAIDRLGHSVAVLTAVQDRYRANATKPVPPAYGAATSLQSWCELCERSVVCSCRFGTDSASSQGRPEKTHPAAPL
jgi:hypothetical protein